MPTIGPTYMRRSEGSRNAPAASDLQLYVQAPNGGWSSPAARALCEATGLCDPVQAIMQRAQEVVGLSGLKRPFQNLPLLASIQNVSRVVEVEMAGAGCLIPTPDGYHIHVNRSDALRRRRFTICHEIGHTLIPSGSGMVTRHEDAATGSYRHEQEEEFFCDLAASELLIPTGEFLRTLAHHRLHVWSIERLAEEYGASLEATAVKCVHTCAKGLAVIVWDGPSSSRSPVSGVLPPVGQLRLRYAVTGLGFAGVSFLRGALISLASNIGRAYRTGSWIAEAHCLPTSSGERRYWAETKGFSRIVHDHWQSKAITMVFAPGHTPQY